MNYSLSWLWRKKWFLSLLFSSVILTLFYSLLLVCVVRLSIIIFIIIFMTVHLLQQSMFIAVCEAVMVGHGIRLGVCDCVFVSFLCVSLDEY